MPIKMFLMLRTIYCNLNVNCRICVKLELLPQVAHFTHAETAQGCPKHFKIHS